MGPRAIVACVALCVASALATVTAAAQSRDVAAGRRAFADARFDAATEAFDNVLRDGNATLAELVEAHRHLAVLRGAAGDNARAEGHIQAALALFPPTVPPDGAPPEVVAVFDRIRAAREGRRARVGLSMPRRVVAQRASLARVAAADVPSSLGARVSARCTADGAEVAMRDVPAVRQPTTLTIEPLPAGALLSCSATLVTREGVVLDRADGTEPVVRPSSGSNVAAYALAAGGVLVVGAIVAVLLLASPAGPQDAHLGAPRVAP